MPSTPISYALVLSSVLAARARNTIASAYLFGGHAEGRAHRDSDLDIGVLLRRELCPTARDRFEEGVFLNSWIAAETKYAMVDLVVLNDAPPGLAARIVTAGIALYCADRDIDRAFWRDTQLRAADVEPFLRRARRLKLEAIAR